MGVILLCGSGYKLNKNTTSSIFKMCSLAVLLMVVLISLGFN